MVKSTNNNSNDPSENKHEQKLQAVLLADTFSNAFHPITFEPYNPISSTTDASSTTNNGTSSGVGKGCTGGKEGKGQERPLVLCPLNNVPLLHHTIDFLQGSGVEELFLLCSSGADALEEYIKVYAGGKANNAKGYAKGIATTAGSGGGGIKGGVEISKEFHRSNSSVEGKIIWSSKLTISLLRFTDCTNAGE